jgi:hypothetical protein
LVIIWSQKWSQWVVKGNISSSGKRPVPADTRAPEVCPSGAKKSPGKSKAVDHWSARGSTKLEPFPPLPLLSLALFPVLSLPAIERYIPLEPVSQQVIVMVVIV